MDYRWKKLSRRETNKSGVTGVSWYKRSGKWRAQIIVDGRALHLGLFDSFDEAVAVRKAANEKFGYHPDHGT